MLAPQVASAQMETSVLWWGRTTGQCQEVGPADYSPVVVVERPPCQATSDESDPAHNVCFEGTPAPISTLPHMLARWQAELVTAKMLQTVSKVHGRLLAEGPSETIAEPWTFEAPQSAFFAAVEAIPRAPEPILACYAHPDQCRSLPPLPATLSLGRLVPAHQGAEPRFSIPPQSLADLPGPPAWARLKIGPSLEHRRVPEEPPRS